MAERPLLASLLTQVDGDEDRVVAYADSGPVTLPSFRHQVQCWQAALVATPGSRVALYHEDSLTFAAAPGGGTEVVVTLPLAARGQEAAE